MNQAQAASHPDSPGFGEWVRTQRKALWLTQKKLARLVGCAPVTIQKIEQDRRRPSPAVAEALARHLEIGAGERETFLRLARTTPTVARPAPAVIGSGPETEASSTRWFADLQLGDHRLPLLSQPLLGRGQVLADIQAALLHSGRRLLTLTGPPGVGKTRLALEVASGLRSAFPDGVYFLSLTALDDPAQVLPALGRRLGLSDGGVQPPAERLARWLRGRQLLIVLDNFEHLLPAAVEVGETLHRCPDLRLLITSRSALRLSAEQEWPLSPLTLPDTGGPPLESPAVQLFVERVRAFDPAFDPDVRTQGVVAEVVTRLEGLPLAIELAAVRLRYQSPEDLAARLRAEPLLALGTGPVDGPERQHTLQQAIAWSYERLDARVQQVFRHLGVFMGGFTAQAAQGVAGAVPGDLEGLLDGHLIRLQGGRFTLFETLRAYASGRLQERQEVESAQTAHRLYFQQAVSEHGFTDNDWYEAEVGNLRLALRSGLEAGQVEAALHLAMGIYWFWETRGYQSEGVQWFRTILERSASLPVERRLVGLNTGSTMAWQSGNFDLSRAWLTEATALSRATGDMNWEAALLMHQGKVELEQGQYAQAQVALELALPLARGLTRPQLISAVLLQLADVRLCLGELDRARALADEGLALCAREPGMFWEAPLLQVVALIALERGDHPAARTMLLRALGQVSDREHRLMMTLLLTGLAASMCTPDALQDDLLRAAQLWGCVEAAREASGYRWSVAFAERFGRWTTRARQRSEDLEWNLAWAGGRLLSVQEAAADLLARNGLSETRTGLRF